MSRGLDSSRLVHRNMATLGSKDTLVTSQHSIDSRGIGLRAPHKEHNLSIIDAYGATQKLASTLRVGIVAITYGVLKISINKRPKHLWVRTSHIVRIEIEHI